MNRETFAAYLVDLAEFPARVVEQACQEIGRRARAEFEDKWPELGAIRAHCGSILRLERERAESRRLLAPPPGPLCPPEKVEAFMAQIRQAIGKKAIR